MSGWPTVEALQIAEKQASKAHDAMWAMDFDKTSAGEFERDQWKRLRDQASKAIWKLHDAIRPALSALATKDSEAVLPRSSAPGLEALEAERDEGLDWYGDLAAVEAERDRAMTAAEEALRLGDKLEILTTLAQDRASAAEASRDQAIKERDEAREALRGVKWVAQRRQEYHTGFVHIIRMVDSALAGVPGGSEQEEQEELGGDRGRSPVVKDEEA